MATAMHTGTFQGIPPTSTRVTVTRSWIDRVVDGRIVERWGQVDLLGTLQQLGIIPAPEESRPYGASSCCRADDRKRVRL